VSDAFRGTARTAPVKQAGRRRMWGIAWLY